MHTTELPYPGIVLRSNTLRRTAAESITFVERDVTGAKQAASARELAAFFDACAIAVGNIGKPKA